MKPVETPLYTHKKVRVKKANEALAVFEIVLAVRARCERKAREKRPSLP